MCQQKFKSSCQEMLSLERMRDAMGLSLNMTYKEQGLTINFNKTEFIAINTEQRFHINLEENVTNKQVQNFKYLGIILNKKV